eukprot:CAMPEP_0184644808 /NCGR_PEP_ID=MMETSP0308-20130426/1444_1 /TAXON_ID=38269 /ORGANISM="Gloeochaete witrockiana, Strain SAG 46.84" /LENGTH=759 /DNA_ID=CAMNT_0027073517 /DNA_START=311 /DNA_END=2590 /DNA_ORIENTATION=-
MVVSSGFEGPEKKLEMDFCNISGDGFRSISAEEWQTCLNFAKCTILSKKSNDDFDAYLLSESSCFIYRHKILLKTCGTTVLLNCIPKILEFAAELGASVEFVRFSRSNFMFPNEQPFPHSSFEQEAAYLDQFFDGSAYVLGPLNGNRWNLYIADYGPIPYEGEIEQQLEIQMSDLDPDVMGVFFQSSGLTSPSEVTTVSGIRTLLLDQSLIDDWSFIPCGYSMNGLSGKAYYTIHITPESHCSYVSFETNLPLASYNDLIKRVVNTFKPGRISVTLFADERAPCGDPDTAFSKDLSGFLLKDRTIHKFECNYWVLSCQYLLSPSEPARGLVPEPSPLRKLSVRKPSLPIIPIPAEPSRSPPLSPTLQLSVREEFEVERVAKDYKISDIINAKIAKHQLEDAFYIVDLGIVLRKHAQWKRLLPRVEPFYAVKSNPNPAILATLNSIGCGFDCASKAEISQILDIGVPANRILYANPCKMASQIRYARTACVEWMTFDNESELQKIRANYATCKLLLRISSAACDKVDCKFGASLDECYGLIRLCREWKLNLVGVSFHVGRPNTPDAYVTAMRTAREVFDMAEQEGIEPMNVLDIGGGFPATDSESPNFADVALTVSPVLDELFEPSVRIISEPGRYFAGESHTLAVNVFARRHHIVAETGDARFLYYINDGIYGSFNCLLFDQAKVVPIPLAKRSANAPTHHSTIFGPTCDSLDCVADSSLLPELDIGDWLYFCNMGAYTVSASTGFNGFAGPQAFYIQS